MKPWPFDTIAARMAITAVLSLIVFLLASLGLVFVEGPVEVSSMPWGASSIGVASNILERVPRAERALVVDKLVHPTTTVRLADAPRGDLEEASGVLFWLIRHRLASYSRPEPRPVLINRLPEAEGSRLLMQIGLADGEWLQVEVPGDIVEKLLLGQFAVRAAVLCLAIVLVSVWAAGRLAAPISAFAEAALRLGKDSRAPPLAERGPQELRQAIRAFNEMQERLRRYVDDRTQMLAAISHDLRTPLTRMRMRAEFVDDPDTHQKMLDDVEAMSTMIRSVLSFAREDADREPRLLVDLGVLLEDLCEDAAEAGGAVRFLGGERAEVVCRPLALSRAVTNLVENALKYGREARVALRVEAERVAITIDDDGPGIPAEQQEQVFAPFFRLDGSRNADSGGVGLGLAVARTIAREHGGDIVLANRPEGGLTACLELPV